MIMADVDGLKYVNDTYGHQSGDLLLKEVTKILRDNFRDDDLIARTGGDEFCIILSSTSKEEAEKIVKRINRKCLIQSSKRFPISISFGISEGNTGEKPVKKILREAEKLMYEKKFIKKLCQDFEENERSK
jgi:diguanylate cyclase (GGDEF)-like protein